MAATTSQIIGGMFGRECCVVPCTAEATPDRLQANEPVTSCDTFHALEHRERFAIQAPWRAAQPRNRTLLFVNARSAIDTIVDLLRPPHIWLPSYLCESLVHAACDRLQIQPDFYAIDESLQIADRCWIDQIHRGDLVVLVSYFGFPFDVRYAQAAQERGAWVLEDACGGMFRHVCPITADFVVSSPRKFVGVVDGGVLSFRAGIDLDWPVLQEPPAAWMQRATEAHVARSRFDEGHGERDWFTQFQTVEATQPCGHFSISRDSSAELDAIDYAAVATRRRANYRLLLEYLAPWAMAKQLPPDVVPLGFPIRVPDRNALLKRLYAAQIYAPVHWPLCNTVPQEHEASWRLSESLLTVPCDQRIATDRMAEVGEIVRKELQR